MCHVVIIAFSVGLELCRGCSVSVILAKSEKIKCYTVLAFDSRVAARSDQQSCNQKVPNSIPCNRRCCVYQQTFVKVSLVNVNHCRYEDQQNGWISMKTITIHSLVISAICADQWISQQKIVQPIVLGNTLHEFDEKSNTTLMPVCLVWG